MNIVLKTPKLLGTRLPADRAPRFPIPVWDLLGPTYKQWNGGSYSSRIKLYGT